MKTMLKITGLALALTAVAALHKAVEATMLEASGSTTKKPVNNTFYKFWTNFTKVWTANSTVPFYQCEWQEPKNITEAGLTTVTHFEGRHSFTLNWTFAKNNTLTSKLPDGEITRSFVYRNNSCAVFKDEISWNITENKPKKPKEKKEKNGQNIGQQGLFNIDWCFLRRRNNMCPLTADMNTEM
uniref:Putative lipocalin n=1 Tax=Rhipicephalus microplus TaxID=6941 RepID=A0A6G5A523_RHIMP